jgi:hypothetical protein
VKIPSRRRAAGAGAELEAELRAQVTDSEQKLRVAVDVDHDFEAHLHSARLLDLLDRARSNNIDTTEWVDPDILTIAQGSA